MEQPIDPPPEQPPGEPTLALIAARLESLRAEQADGLQMLAQLQEQEREIRDQLLRVAGAVLVCEELLLGRQPD